MKRFIKRFSIVTAIAFSLQGCIFVAGAAAGAAAIAVVYDHRTLKNTIEDTQLSNKIAEQIYAVPHLRNESHIEVTSFHRVILLTGETPNQAWKQQAEEIARSMASSSRIYNQISIQGPTSSLTRTSDAWITAKIKGQMLATEDLKSSSIKVVTENGVVYLMGIVKREHALDAVDIARQVTGVQKVVKVFQYSR